MNPTSRITVLIMEIKMLKNLILITFCLVVFTGAVFAQQATPGATAKPTPTPQPTKKANERPAAAASTEPFDKATVEVMKTKCVTLETESGIIEMEMYPESAPETVRNFLNLTALGAFDTTTFSRVVPGFVVQGGNLSTRETKSSELSQRARRTIPDEPNLIRHERGILSMARSDQPNSASSHFFILVSEAPTLDGKFAAFGRVTRGMEVVDAINKMEVEGDKPVKPVRLKRVTTISCPAQTESQDKP
jgi:peptidyl-prolyl cis-trans isomerase B (cyclophilin B)